MNNTVFLILYGKILIFNYPLNKTNAPQSSMQSISPILLKGGGKEYGGGPRYIYGRAIN
jgi:hypothetical protein